MPFIFILNVIFYFFAYPFQIFSDGSVRQHFISKLVHNGTLESMKYSVIGPLFSAPLVFLDKILDTNFWLLRYNFLFFCITSYILYRLLYTEREKYFLFVFMVLLFFGSMFPAHIIHYYGEVFSATLMMLGIALAEKKHKAVGWTLMVLSVGNTPASFLPLLFVCAYKIIKQRDFSYIILPLMAAATLYIEPKIRMSKASMAYTKYLIDDHGFKNLLPYSGRAGFSYPMFLGILGQLFSFGKGLLFFAPGIVFIPMVLKKLTDSRLRTILLLWTVYLIGLVLVYSKWWSWYGGWFWGPRFLLFASIPASFALAYALTHTTSKTTRIVAALIALWSFWVGVNGVVFQQKNLDICTAHQYAQEYLCWFVPEFSVLFHPFVVKPIPADLVGCIIAFLGLFWWSVVTFRRKNS